MEKTMQNAAQTANYRYRWIFFKQIWKAEYGNLEGLEEKQICWVIPIIVFHKRESSKSTRPEKYEQQADIGYFHWKT